MEIDTQINLFQTGAGKEYAFAKLVVDIKNFNNIILCFVKKAREKELISWGI